MKAAIPATSATQVRLASESAQEVAALLGVDRPSLCTAQRRQDEVSGADHIWRFSLPVQSHRAFPPECIAGSCSAGADGKSASSCAGCGCYKHVHGDVRSDPFYCMYASAKHERLFSSALKASGNGAVCPPAERKSFVSEPHVAFALLFDRAALFEVIWVPSKRLARS